MKVSFIIGGLGDVFALWGEANAREKGILLLVFAPMFLSLGGLLFSIASFVLFVLPSFILRLLGWGLLAALFSAGGRYCYAHITERVHSDGASAPAYTDVEFREHKAPNETKRESAGMRDNEDDVRKIKRGGRPRQVDSEVEAEVIDEDGGQGDGGLAGDLEAIRQRWAERVKGKR